MSQLIRTELHVSINQHVHPPTLTFAFQTSDKSMCYSSEKIESLAANKV